MGQTLKDFFTEETKDSENPVIIGTPEVTLKDLEGKTPEELGQFIVYRLTDVIHQEQESSDSSPENSPPHKPFTKQGVGTMKAVVKKSGFDENKIKGLKKNQQTQKFIKNIVHILNYANYSKTIDSDGKITFKIANIENSRKKNTQDTFEKKEFYHHFLRHALKPFSKSYTGGKNYHYDNHIFYSKGFSDNNYNDFLITSENFSFAYFLSDIMNSDIVPFHIKKYRYVAESNTIDQAEKNLKSFQTKSKVEDTKDSSIEIDLVSYWLSIHVHEIFKSMGNSYDKDLLFDGSSGLEKKKEDIAEIIRTNIQNLVDFQENTSGDPITDDDLSKNFSVIFNRINNDHSCENIDFFGYNQVVTEELSTKNIFDIIKKLKKNEYSSILKEKEPIKKSIENLLKNKNTTTSQQYEKSINGKFLEFYQDFPSQLAELITLAKLAYIAQKKGLAHQIDFKKYILNTVGVNTSTDTIKPQDRLKKTGPILSIANLTEPAPLHKGNTLFDTQEKLEKRNKGKPITITIAPPPTKEPTVKPKKTPKKTSAPPGKPTKGTPITPEPPKTDPTPEKPTDTENKQPVTTPERSSNDGKSSSYTTLNESPKGSKRNKKSYEFHNKDGNGENGGNVHVDVYNTQPAIKIPPTTVTVQPANINLPELSSNPAYLFLLDKYKDLERKLDEFSKLPHSETKTQKINDCSELKDEFAKKLDDLAKQLEKKPDIKINIDDYDEYLDRLEGIEDGLKDLFARNKKQSNIPLRPQLHVLNEPNGPEPPDFMNLENKTNNHPVVKALYGAVFGAALSVLIFSFAPLALAITATVFAVLSSSVFGAINERTARNKDGKTPEERLKQMMLPKGIDKTMLDHKEDKIARFPKKTVGYGVLFTVAAITSLIFIATGGIASLLTIPAALVVAKTAGAAFIVTSIASAPNTKYFHLHNEIQKLENNFAVHEAKTHTHRIHQDKQYAMQKATEFVNDNNITMDPEKEEQQIMQELDAEENGHDNPDFESSPNSAVDSAEYEGLDKDKTMSVG